MSVMQEFKKFAVRGNVVDMAVGVIIGGAFGKIVSSLVDDIIMPPIGLALAGVDFSKLGWVLRAASEGQAEVVIRYGKFLQISLNFLIVAWIIFLLVKAMNHLREQFEEPAAPPAPPEPPKPPRQEVLLEEIRDLLKKS